MQSQTSITPKTVSHIAQLANIPVTDSEIEKIADGFNTVLLVLNELNSIDVSHVEPTHQVTGMENIFREDSIDVSRTFTQEQALTNAPKSYNGYFLVERVLDNT